MIDLEAPGGRIAPTGEYDTLKEGWLVRHVGEALATGRPVVHVDLGGLDFGGAALVNDVVRCQHLCDAAGVPLRVSFDQPQMHRLFSVCAPALRPAG